MVELLGVGQLQVVLHVGVMAHTWSKKSEKKLLLLTILPNIYVSQSLVSGHSDMKTDCKKC